jgi:hypothetical protein
MPPCNVSGRQCVTHGLRQELAADGKKIRASAQRVVWLTKEQRLRESLSWNLSGKHLNSVAPPTLIQRSQALDTEQSTHLVLPCMHREFSAQNVLGSESTILLLWRAKNDLKL